MKCERTNCWQSAAWMLEMHHGQGDGRSQRERRTLCDIHAKEELPQNLSPLSEWEVERLGFNVASEADA